MKPNFVETKNFRKFITRVEEVKSRSVPEANLLVMTGPAGIGKTMLGNFWGIQNNAINLRLTAACTPHWVFSDLLRAMGETNEHSCEKMYAKAVTKLMRNPRPIIVDEVENGLANIKVLESIRDVGDACELPAVIFLGREYVPDRLERYPHFHTRISRYVSASKISLSDTKKCCEELAEVGIADDLVEHINDEADGHIRNVVKAITEVERYARKAGKKNFTLADLAGRPLLPNAEAAKRED